VPFAAVQMARVNSFQQDVQYLQEDVSLFKDFAAQFHDVANFFDG
jgi:hypothetical protein